MMNEGQKHAGTLELRGERLCLDFANTAGWHATDAPQEWLLSYADLLAWGRHAGMLTRQQEARLLQKANANPPTAEAELAMAVALREAIYRLFSHIAQGRLPQEEDLSILQRAYAEAMAHAYIVPQAASFTYAWRESEEALDVPLWPIAHSGMELLFSQEWRHVKECPGDGCGWLFLDRSRNQSRRWCNGRDCGNRIRVRQHYQRHRTAQNAEGPQ